MKKEDTFDYNVKTVWHAVSRMYNVEASKFDMTMSIGYVLLNIDLQHGTFATKIAPQVGLEVRSLTRTLKRMEEDGLIYRVSDNADRRLVRVCLTELGKVKREIARKTVLRFNYAVRELIPDEQLDVFFSVIRQVSTMLEVNNIFDSPIPIQPKS